MLLLEALSFAQETLMDKTTFEKHRQKCPCNTINGKGCRATNYERCLFSQCPFIFWLSVAESNQPVATNNINNINKRRDRNDNA